MKPKIIEANGWNFIIHFVDEGGDDYKMRWSGTATQIQLYSDGTWEYQSNESSGSVDELKDARVWFEWSFCYRGVWEGRVYFKDSEYWGEEMKTIPEIWDLVQGSVKERIRIDNPDYNFFDN